ncbi:helix-turn-helix domain-containing protein [Streptomyces virginiae]|nr:helix-turn-helix transcriptional regulator [Streptomyces sp. NRRL B-1322]
MTQADPARASHVSLPMIKGCERGVRSPGPSTLEAIASALGVDPSRLDPAHVGTGRRVHAALPAISAAIAGYEIALDPPLRPPAKLREDVANAVGWRLAAQYGLIAAQAPQLLGDALAHLHSASGTHRNEAANLVVAAARAADATAYKYGAHDPFSPTDRCDAMGRRTSRGRGPRRFRRICARRDLPRHPRPPVGPSHVGTGSGFVPLAEHRSVGGSPGSPSHADRGGRRASWCRG